MVDQAIVDRFWSKVNKTDDCWVWASIPRDRYARFVVSKPSLKEAAHRFSWQLANGPIPEGMFIDHICRTHSCVRPDHLRLATPKQNLEHLAEVRSNNTSGYRGVVWNKKYGYWQAVVVHNYHPYFLGYFESAEEADAVARAKRLELYTHNALDRVPGAIVEIRPVIRCSVETRRAGPCIRRVRIAGEHCWNHGGIAHSPKSVPAVANRQKGADA